jgi:hypothetical protein
MKIWGTVSICGWAHRWPTSLTKAYKNLFPDGTSASILVVTMLRSILSVYKLFAYSNFFFSLHIWLTAHQRLLSKLPSYIKVTPHHFKMCLHYFNKNPTWVFKKTDF